MKISTFMISIAIVGLFITGFSAYFADIGNQYGQEIDEDTNATLTRLNQLSAITETTQEINQTLFKDSSGESGTFDLVSTFLGAGFNVLKIAKDSFGSFYTLLETATSAIGIPGIFLDTILVIVVIVLLFVIIKVLVGTEV